MGYQYVSKTFQPCHCQNLEDPKIFFKKPQDLAKSLAVSADSKLNYDD